MNLPIAVIALWLAMVGPFSSALAADPAATSGGLDPATTAAAAAESATAKSATLKVFNRPIAVFRKPFIGTPPAERALLGRERVYSILEQGGPGAVTWEHIAQGNVVKVDGSYAFILTNDDVPSGSGETLDTVTAAAIASLERAIGETHEARDATLLTRAAVHSAIATVVFIVLLYVLVRVGRWLTKRVLRLTHTASSRFKIGGAALVQRRRAFHAVHLVLRVAGWAAFLLVTYEWLGFVLARFPYTRAWGEQLNGFLFGTATKILVAIATAAPELLIAIVVFVIAHAIDRAQKGFFDGVEQGRIRVGWVDRDTARPTRKLVTIAVWVFALVMAYPYIPGSDTDAFKGLSVLLGLMVSVGASGIVGQAASGLILMYTRTFRVGEFVRIGEAEGTVATMGMFTTHVRTGMGEVLTLPNSHVLSSVVRNYSRPLQGAGFVLTATVTIGYDVPWRQVEAMLIAAAGRTPRVSPYPPARVFVHALSDFYVEYRVICQSNDRDPQVRAAALSALHGAILDEFNAHGVQIMSPHYFGDPAQAKVVPPADWYKAPAQPPS
jgi:small-conductance mechanosensitive channel